MSESADDPITCLEDLLRGLASLPPRRPETVHSVSEFGSRSIVAAVIALLIFVPGCATATIFLLQSDDAVALPVQSPASEPLLAKSDRLPPFARTALAPQDVADLGAPAMRGRIEDVAVAVTSESVIEQQAVAEVAAAPKSKARRRVVHVKTPRLVAEIISPEPEPPSLLQRLFGRHTL